ncbi:MAG: hypothetical protein SFY66_19705 [Oculatellaceae cyanobacterium bins.114]|nr:hypothetical protein [Oculatellaceae cyanobacterium bins.114]
MRSPQLILKNPNSNIPDWLSLVEQCVVVDNDQYCFYVAAMPIEQAIAHLAQLGFEVWAKEHWNYGWVSRKL